MQSFVSRYIIEPKMVIHPLMIDLIPLLDKPIKLVFSKYGLDVIAYIFDMAYEQEMNLSNPDDVSNIDWCRLRHDIIYPDVDVYQTFTKYLTGIHSNAVKYIYNNYNDLLLNSYFILSIDHTYYFDDPIYEQNEDNKFNDLDTALKLQYLAHNENPEAIKIIEQHIDKVIEYNNLIVNDWYEDRIYNIIRILSSNSSAGHLFKHFEMLHLNMHSVATNPSAIDYIADNIDNITDTYFGRIALNPKIEDFLNNPKVIFQKDYVMNRLDWQLLSSNKYAVSIIHEELKKDTSRICWVNLSMNTGLGILDILREELKKETNKVDLISFCSRNEKETVQFILQNKELQNKILNCRKCCNKIFSNPLYLPLIEIRIKKPIDSELCRKLYKMPKAFHLLSKLINNPLSESEKWVCLSENPKAIKLLEKNPEKINIYRFIHNPAILQIDRIDFNERVNRLSNIITKLFP